MNRSTIAIGAFAGLAMLVLSPSASQSQSPNPQNGRIHLAADMPVIKKHKTKKMSPKGGQRPLCKPINSKCSSDSECCSGACDTLPGGDMECI